MVLLSCLSFGILAALMIMMYSPLLCARSACPLMISFTTFTAVSFFSFSVTLKSTSVKLYCIFFPDSFSTLRSAVVAFSLLNETLMSLSCDHADRQMKSDKKPINRNLLFGKQFFIFCVFVFLFDI